MAVTIGIMPKTKIGIMPKTTMGIMPKTMIGIMPKTTIGIMPKTMIAIMPKTATVTTPKTKIGRRNGERSRAGRNITTDILQWGRCRRIRVSSVKAAVACLDGD